MTFIIARDFCPTCGQEITSWNPLTGCKCCGKLTCQTCNPKTNIVCPACKMQGMTLGRGVMFV